MVNPWRDHARGIDFDAAAPGIRAAQLEAYLEARLDSARILLLGEAPGYRGARFSGIAMTSERMLSGPEVAGRRTSHPDIGGAAGFTEPTSTIVWRELGVRGREVVLWNVFPFHPHPPGRPLGNRRPTGAEIARHGAILTDFLALFPGDVRIVAMGTVAADHLARRGIAATALRHPSHGGAVAFATGLRTILGPETGI